MIVFHSHREFRAHELDRDGAVTASAFFDGTNVRILLRADAADASAVLSVGEATRIVEKIVRPWISAPRRARKRDIIRSLEADPVRGFGAVEASYENRGDPFDEGIRFGFGNESGPHLSFALADQSLVEFCAWFDALLEPRPAPSTRRNHFRRF